MVWVYAGSGNVAALESRRGKCYVRDPASQTAPPRKGLAVSRSASEKSLAAISARVHPRCVVCSRDHPGGLRLEFACLPGGGVRATFACAPEYEGYGGYVHGGIVSSLLDGAMTNALFAAGHVALTAELTVRFLEPLRLGVPATVEGRVERSRTRLHETTAEVVQEGRAKATARARFLRHPGHHETEAGS